MFDDLITIDENLILKPINESHNCESNNHESHNYESEPPYSWDLPVKTIFRNFDETIDNYLSKESETFQYNYGRVNGMVPERPSFFHTQYPKKATSLDSEQHHLNFDIEILTRWIPREVLKCFVPILYFQDLRKEENKKRLLNNSESNIEYNFTARPVPTLQELLMCETLQGKGFWDRNGTWFCTSQNVLTKPFKLDEFGPSIFKTYNEWIVWELRIQKKINEAKENENWNLVHELRKAKHPPEKK